MDIDWAALILFVVAVPLAVIGAVCFAIAVRRGVLAERERARELN